MFGFLSALLGLAVQAAKAHPEVTGPLISGIADAISGHEQHPEPGSTEAITALRAGIAAAAGGAVTSVIMKETQHLQNAIAPAAAVQDAQIVSETADPPPAAPKTNGLP